MYSNNSGMSGMSGLSTFARNDSLISTTCRKQKLKGKTFTLMSLFAGKMFCFSDFKRSLQDVPASDCHAVFYDNSGNDRFHEQLRELITDTFDSYELVRDDNPRASIESTTDWKAIIEACNTAYQSAYRYVPLSVPYILNLEDDVGVPAGSCDRLYRLLEENPKAGTAIGVLRDRRAIPQGLEPEPIVVNFKQTHSIIPGSDVEIECSRAVPRAIGVEAVGAGHMGLWLSRTECFKKIGMKTYLGSPNGQDIQWGLRLNRAGWFFLVDWSIRLKHFYRSEGRKLSV